MKSMYTNEVIINRFMIGTVSIQSLLLFIIFLVPYSILEGLSANYLFVFYPAICIVVYNRAIYAPDRLFSIIMFLYILFFFIGIPYQDNLFELIRSMSSFFIFLAAFSFVFIRIDPNIITSFKVAVVIISLYYSIYHMVLFFDGGGSGAGFSQKSITGGSRYGFVYLLAFWIVFIWNANTRFRLLIKYISIAILSIGLFLTFSRSSMAALSFSMFFYLLYSIRSISIKNIFYMCVGGGVVFLLLSEYFQVTLTFMDHRIISDVQSGALIERMENKMSSVGTRIFILETVVGHLLNNNFISGSGYIGVWSMQILDGIAGSAHSQYVDVLFRTGFLGLLLYVFLLSKLYRFLQKYHKDLFFGFIGVLCYGLFHETFKESQGGFILAFLFGMLQTYRHDVKYKEMLKTI